MSQTWQIETEDFRRTAYTPTRHDGDAWLIATAEYFEGGRWEGRVTMIRDTPDARRRHGVEVV